MAKNPIRAVVLVAFVLFFLPSSAAADKIKSIAKAGDRQWKIEIQKNASYHINITNLHDDAAQCEIRIGDAKGNVIGTLQKTNLKYSDVIKSYAVWVSCSVNGTRSEVVSAERDGGGGSASFSFEAAAMSIGAN